MTARLQGARGRDRMTDDAPSTLLRAGRRTGWRCRSDRRFCRERPDDQGKYCNHHRADEPEAFAVLDGPWDRDTACRRGRSRGRLNQVRASSHLVRLPGGSHRGGCLRSGTLVSSSSSERSRYPAQFSQSGPRSLLTPRPRAASTPGWSAVGSSASRRQCEESPPSSIRRRVRRAHFPPKLKSDFWPLT
jgi:hypothetical protein